MRIACHQCSAKYTIGEEKLRHGPVRLRCRKCRTLIVVQPDGSITGGDEHASSSVDPPSDGSLQPSALPAPPTPPPPVAVARPNPVGPPAAKSSVSPDGPTLPGLPDAYAPPPRAARVSTVDLDEEPLAAATGSAGSSTSRAWTAPAPSGALHEPASPPLTSLTSSLPPRSVSEPGRVPGRAVWGPILAWISALPVTRYGWAALAAIAVVGLLLGALLSSGPEEGQLPFDAEQARQALNDAALSARQCFPAGPPALAGTVEIWVEPDGEPREVKLGGGLFHSAERECIHDHFEDLRLPAFSGPSVRLKKTLSLSGAR